MEEMKIDEKELYKQMLEELEGKEHAFIIKIGIPAITFEKMLTEKNIDTNIDTVPIADIHSTKGGTNAVTRAFAIVILKEIVNELLSEKDTSDAYSLIKSVLKTKMVNMNFEEEKNDTDSNSKG